MRLAVADLARSVDFYERVLGLPLLDASDEQRRSSAPAAGRPALDAERDQRRRRPPRRTHGPLPRRLAAPLARGARRHRAADRARRGWPIDGASDHGVSEALYLSDPDGLGIEIYADRPREQWERAADGRGVKMVTEPLDLDDLLAQARRARRRRDRAGDDRGHVHLKVADVPRADAFYRDVLGFEEQARCPPRRSWRPAATTTTSG